MAKICREAIDGLREAESLVRDNTAADRDCDPGRLNRGSLHGPSTCPLRAAGRSGLPQPECPCLPLLVRAEMCPFPNPCAMSPGPRLSCQAPGSLHVSPTPTSTPWSPAHLFSVPKCPDPNCLLEAALGLKSWSPASSKLPAPSPVRLCLVAS